MIAALDFVRLGSWDFAEYALSLSDFMTTYEGGWEQGKWLQYTGWRKPSIFMGLGEQNGERHSIVSVSGYRANEYKTFLLTLENHYCTRLDVQVTIPCPDGVDLVELHTDLQKTTKTTVISSEENDTLYLGDRKSDVFTRLYEKFLEKKYLRLEFELKGKRARSAWRALLAGSNEDELFQHYLKWSKLPDYVKRHYHNAADGGTAFAIRQEIEKDAHNRLKWLQSLDGCIVKAMYDDNIGSQVRDILQAWGMQASQFDNILEND